ncbi:MAG: hypothetical protein HLUCCO16_09870 [Phormidium sp. OSCR]|nr:MAG: hypothetical protein HLUCCO16_09870 [Phormidium sp. OSCR]
MSSPAYLLVAHGSRDPRPAKIVNHLAVQMRERLGGHPVGTAALDCQPQPLHEQLERFCQQVQSPVQILPLFLLPGVHVREDIPEEVAIARSHLPDSQTIEILPYLGSHDGLSQVLREQIQARGDCQAWILLAHGSRRPGGNAPIEAIAAQLPQQVGRPVRPAYWSVEPSLERQLDEYEQAGYARVGVLPYFLCPGGLTDAISEQLRSRSGLHLDLSETLSESPHLIEVLLDLRQRVPVPFAG